MTAKFPNGIAAKSSRHDFVESYSNFYLKVCKTIDLFGIENPFKVNNRLEKKYFSKPTLKRNE